jgi:hypothetical protein
MIQKKNFADMPVGDIPVDVEYRMCNFARTAPDTSEALPKGVRLFPGDDTPRTFVDCNLKNCEVPPGSTVTRCNTWVAESGVLSHSDDLTVDGVVVHSEQFHNSITHGRYVDGVLDRTGYPVTYPEDYVE